MLRRLLLALVLIAVVAVPLRADDQPARARGVTVVVLLDESALVSPAMQREMLARLAGARIATPAMAGAVTGDGRLALLQVLGNPFVDRGMTGATREQMIAAVVAVLRELQTELDAIVAADAAQRHARASVQREAELVRLKLAIADADRRLKVLAEREKSVSRDDTTQLEAVSAALRAVRAERVAFEVALAAADAVVPASALAPIRPRVVQLGDGADVLKALAAE